MAQPIAQKGGRRTGSPGRGHPMRRGNVRCWGSHPPGMPRVRWFHATIRPIRLATRSLSAALRSHRHSLRWHRSPPPYHCRDEQSAAPGTAQRLSACRPAGWPTSNRIGRDQIGISGRLPSEYEDALPVQREAIPAGQVWTQRRQRGTPRPRQSLHSLQLAAEHHRCRSDRRWADR